MMAGSTWLLRVVANGSILLFAVARTDLHWSTSWPLILR
jgi:hypothetical protein